MMEKPSEDTVESIISECELNKIGTEKEIQDIIQMALDGNVDGALASLNEFDYKEQQGFNAAQQGGDLGGPYDATMPFRERVPELKRLRKRLEEMK